MRKFFVKENQIEDKHIQIIGEDVNHIRNVLRLPVGEKIKICDAEHQINYICEIIEITKQIVSCKIIEKTDLQTEGNIQLDIFQGLPKADKMEFIIQKGTELGVTKFIPVALKRCIVKLDDKNASKKIERWQKIAEVAAKQCGRDCIPQVTQIQSIQNICDRIKQYDIVLVAYELEKEHYIKQVLQSLTPKDTYKIAVVIGPEGGLEENEVEQLQQAGVKVITLGKRILRTETVALQITSIIMYELEKT